MRMTQESWHASCQMGKRARLANSEAWLAIDAFGGDILQAITPSAEMVQHRYRTAFRRVYVVDRAEPRVLRLDTEPLR